MPQTNDVNLGIGNVSGYFFHAPAGTAIPTTIEGATAWAPVGYVSEDGITWHTGIDMDTLKDWARKIVRTLPGEDDPSVTVPVISTTAESLKTVFGADNVTVVPANAAAGEKMMVTVRNDIIIPAEAFMFVMKDGEDMMILGTTEGFINALDDVAFTPGGAITWNATISASEWTFGKMTALDDGSSSD